MGFQVEHTGQQGSIFRRNNMHHLMVGGESTNSAFIMTVSSYRTATTAWWFRTIASRT